MKNRDHNQPLTLLVGHSHGNVAILAANMLKEKGIQVNNVITINAPVREHHLDVGATEKHVNIFKNKYPLQGSGGNSTLKPDKVVVLPTGEVIPVSYEGSIKPTGEMGSAGRLFDITTTIRVLFATRIHDSHNKPELWKQKLHEAIN